MRTRTMRVIHTNLSTDRADARIGAEGRRGGTGLLVVAGVAAAALIAFLTIDLDELERGRARAALGERVAAYTEARTNEDAAALVELLVPKAREEFDAEHMALRWAFDRSDVLSMGEPDLGDIRWDKGLAKVARTVRVETEVEPVEVERHPFDLAPDDGGAQVETTEESEHEVTSTWLLVDGEWFLSPADEPWGRTRLEALHGERIASLRSRFDRFVEVRLVDDQQALYTMYRQEDRDGTSLGQYLSIYGQGVMKVHGIELEELAVRETGDLADVTYQLDSEMVLANLPPQMRARLAGTPKEELRRQVQVNQTWHFTDGEWWLQMEEDPTKEVRTNKIGG